MFGAVARKLFGTANDRYVKSLGPIVHAINARESEMAALSDEALRGQTDKLKAQLAAGKTLDDVLVEAFATVREAAKRTLGQRHFDVQMMGGIVLHRGMIAEMKTGEGKTLVSTLAAYLNALSGKGVHIVTVNDYLARRDADWMGQIHRFLGLSVGVIVPGLMDEERRQAYAADITYSTNNELGFDYLRDNMKLRLEMMVQREPNFAIVDEVDSILIDEARTPLIISGPAEDSSALYRAIDKEIPHLEPSAYEIDEKTRSVTLTDDGMEAIEERLRQAELMEGGLYDSQNVTQLHHVMQALRAHKLFRRDTEYVVKDGKVVIIDEFTGRMMEGRRYSEGLHQAIEAKEGVEIQGETQTMASITFQNYFRLYPKLAGMTGTAMTEASEFGEIYGLDVIEIPTNVAVARSDADDAVYRTRAEKEKAIVESIVDCQQRGQPVLVGTTSIEKSEELSALLNRKGIKHNVLNARYHEAEAYIIADAGIPGAVTLATNMAGRGTDIQLGGNLEMRIRRELGEVEDEAERGQRIETIKGEIADKRKQALDAGGLYVIGTERHESRRIDNQLRGRSGRQGDPGRSAFFLSLEDDLMRIFAADKIDAMLKRLGVKEDEAISHPWVNKALEKAQARVEQRNFEIRKHLLRFDDVMNDQRKVIYEQRKELMRAQEVHDTVVDMREETLDALMSGYVPEKAYAEQWDIEGLSREVKRIFNLEPPIKDWAAEEGVADTEIRKRLADLVDAKMAEKTANVGLDAMRMIEKNLLLQLLDFHWKEHLLHLDQLRQGINLRAHANRNPLDEYKREAFDMFETMLARLRESVTRVMANVEIRAADPQAQARAAGLVPAAAPAAQMVESRVDPAGAPPVADDEDLPGPDGGDAAVATRPRPVAAVPAASAKVPRNAPCPCGSGKKYKHCHGKTA
ncbi:MAG: preprotein translocase subunit SecA [Alphaproteobacteria bacterium]